MAVHSAGGLRFGRGLGRAVLVAAAGTSAVLSALLVAACPSQRAGSAQAADELTVHEPALVVPNDNRASAGRRRGGAVEVEIVAQTARWLPDLDVDSTVTVQVFAEEGGPPRIPGPLLRADEGADVRVRIRNAFTDSTLVVHGLRAGTVADDTLHVPPGAARVVEFRAGAPGTYLYWGTTTGSPIHDRPWRDSQLTGAIVIDPPGVRPDTAERIFVVTVLDVYVSDTIRNPMKDDIWELAINGRSWPHTERLEYAVGDTVRWRWLNGSYLPHPMHLHGFHFRVTAKGDGAADSLYSADAARDAVTEFMASGSTFAMAWVPTRAGTWLMHCHMVPHIVPFPERAASVREHDAHDIERHAFDAMAGLVLGITTVERGGGDTAGRGHVRVAAPGGSASTAAPPPARRLRLFAQQAATDSRVPTPRGYVLQRGAEPRRDSVEVPGSLLLLTRGETTAITVLNRLDEATTVHWHGMELESVFDGVAGWSRTGSNLAPLLAPGDSFTVAFTPPRAGTFIYHTHMDEGQQLRTGMYAPLLVLEPGERYDAATDLLFVIGHSVVRDSLRVTLNGREDPAALALRAGTRYRLRFINILLAAGAEVTLRADSAVLRWRPLAQDGADLPRVRQAEGPARFRRFGAGETYDFVWIPEGPMDAVLEIVTGDGTLRQMMRVRE